MPGTYWKKRTHCQNGHKFTKENTIIDGDRRRCRRCKTTYELRSQARRRGDVNPELAVCKYLISVQDRVPNEVLREVYLEAVERGASPAEIARQAGLLRSGTNKADVDWLHRCLGIRPTRCGDGRLLLLRTIKSDRALGLLGAIQEFSVHVCACGEVMVDGADACGFCLQERELGIAA